MTQVPAPFQKRREKPTGALINLDIYFHLGDTFFSTSGGEGASIIMFETKLPAIEIGKEGPFVIQTK